MTKLKRRTFLKGTSAVLGSATVFGQLREVVAEEKLRIGVVHLGPIGDVGWEAQHALARKAMEDEYAERVETTVVTEIYQAQDAERVFRDLAVKGHKLVFGTTFSQMAPMLKVAPTQPNTTFECNTAIKTLDNMGAFEARYYEGTYIAGVVAGMMTKSNILGWVGAFPYPNVIMGINGFALGARSVNPDAVVKLIWINSWSDPPKEKDAVNALIAQGADVVSGYPNTPVQGGVAEEKDVWCISFASDYSKYVATKQLTSFMLDWSSAYIEAAGDVLAGTWASKDRWRGLGDGGFMKMAPYNDAIPADVVELAKQRERDIAAGELHPLAGPLIDQSGGQRVPEGQTMARQDIRSFNWLVDGVEGSMPGA